METSANESYVSLYGYRPKSVTVGLGCGSGYTLALFVTTASLRPQLWCCINEPDLCFSFIFPFCCSVGGELVFRLSVVRSGRFSVAYLHSVCLGLLSCILFLYCSVFLGACQCAENGLF